MEIKWLKKLSKKERKNFYILSSINSIILVSGIILSFVGYYHCIIVIALLITYISYYDSLKEYAQIKK